MAGREELIGKRNGRREKRGTEQKYLMAFLFHRVFAAIVFTALSLGRASSFAPDATKAKVSASRILNLLDRRPLINVTSSGGQKLVSRCSVLYCWLAFLSVCSMRDTKSIGLGL